MLYPEINQLIEQFLSEQDRIDPARKVLLKQFADYLKANDPTAINFICTHNSRRSHLAQIWMTVVLEFFKINGIKNYSGGTEVTALNPRVVTALQSLGFQVDAQEGENPHYQIYYGANQALIAYSKLYDAPENPVKNFIAIMTCGHADENCPFIPGASWRLALTYLDPKVSDGTPNEAEVYLERTLQIGREMAYVGHLLD